MKRKKSNLKSSCCNAKIKICGIGDFNDRDRVCTCHYECLKCGQPCNIHLKEKKSSTKLTPKELKEIHQTQDF